LQQLEGMALNHVSLHGVADIHTVFPQAHSKAYADGSGTKVSRNGLEANGIDLAALMPTTMSL